MKNKEIKVGDTVRLKTIELLDGIESINWIEDENMSPQVGDTFKVNHIEYDGWIFLSGLKYAHPIQKFELVS